MSGVGTQLHLFFKWWGFQQTGECGCEIRRNHYNKKGPKWCQDHLDEIVDDLLEEAQTRKRDLTADMKNLLPALSLSLPLSVQRHVLKRIVQVCINRTFKSATTSDSCY